MAFMAAPQASSGGSSEDRMPILSYNAKAGRLFIQDRKQDANGEWATHKTDVTMQQPQFAVDFGRLEVGWAHFQTGVAPQWAMAYFGEPEPAKPASPGQDDRGKDMHFRRAFRIVVIGKEIGGMRELSGNSGAIISGMNELHTLYEQAPEAAAGKIPLVKMVNVLEVKAGQSSNFQPVFAIQGWVERPQVLGPRRVPAPGAKAAPANAAPANHVPPPTAAAPAAAKVEEDMEMPF